MGTVIRVSGFSIWLDLDPKKIDPENFGRKSTGTGSERERVRVVVVQSSPVVIDGRFHGRVSESMWFHSYLCYVTTKQWFLRNTGEDLEPGVGEEDSGLNAAFEGKTAIGIRRSARNK